MPVDLYQDDRSRLTDAEIFQAVEAFTRVSEPMPNRPREGGLLDFKEDWSDRALHTVAGFAHAFGGLLLIGVSERDGQPEKLVGVEMRGELKTTVAGAIATNISPTPLYEIAECSIPDQPSRKLAVVRVRQGNRIYYLTKKGEQPIYIRNEDQSVPADAAQLRSLIERKVQSANSQSEITKRISALRNSTKLERTAQVEPGPIPTSLQIVLAPIDHPRLVLDVSIEQQFRRRISNSFSYLTRDTTYEVEDERWASEYVHRWFRPIDAFESAWRLTSEGDMVFVRQARLRGNPGPIWSLGDTIADLLFFLGVARSMWKLSGYYGEAHLLVGLSVHDLSVAPEILSRTWPAGPYSHFLTNDFNSALRDSIASPALQPAPTATTSGIFNSGLPYDAITETVAQLMNQLLRSLGHGVDLSRLRSAIEIFLRSFR